MSAASAESSSITPYSVTGDNLAVLGEQNVSFKMGGVQFEHRFLVSQLPTTAAGILGVNFLTPRQAKLDFGDCKLTLYKSHSLLTTVQHSTCSRVGARVQKYSLIPHVFISNMVPQVSKSEQVKSSQGRKMPIMLNESEPSSVVSKQTVVLEPRAKHVILGKVVSDNVRDSPTLVCVEPALLPIQGICVARVLTYTESTSGQPHRQEGQSFSRSPEFETRNVLSGSCMTHVKAQGEKLVKGQPCDTVVLMVVNFSEEPLTVQKGTVLGVAQEISENLVVPIDEVKYCFLGQVKG